MTLKFFGSKWVFKLGQKWFGAGIIQLTPVKHTWYWTEGTKD